MSEVQITPTKGAEVPTVGFDIVGYGKFTLPMLGQPGVPFGITNAFGVFQNAQSGGSDEQKLAAWSMMIQTLADSYPQAVRVLSRLDGETVGQVFTQWGKRSEEYDPNQPSSQP